MSIPEASQLVLQAGLMGKGGEIFVLDMGEPVKIADLARDLIRLSGLSEEDVRIEYTGLRRREAVRGTAGRRRTHAAHAAPEAADSRGRSASTPRWLEKLRAWLLQPGRPEDARYAKR